MKKKLTITLLDSIIAKGVAHPPIWDRDLSGFGIRVGKHGTVSFFAMRRQHGGDGKPLRIPCGTYPLTPLADAREKAREALRDLAAGIDPRKVAKAKAVTFGALAEEFIKRHAARKRSARNIELLIRRELIPRWGDKPVGDVSRIDVVDLMDEIVDRGHPAAAHQVFGYAKRVFSWALSRGTYGIEASPFDRLKRGDLLGAKGSRTRLLVSGELSLIWQATEGAPIDVYPDAQFIRLLLMLGLRRGELAGARWSEFDLAAATWVIPGGPLGRTKNGDPLLVSLPVAAMEILNALPRFAGSGHVFTARGNQALNDFVGIKRRLDARITALNGGVPIAPWVLHDTRRAVRTGMSQLRIEPHIAERCLGHRQGGISKVYDLWQFADEKREALERWAARLLSIVTPPPDNVVPLPLRQAS
jgi:integrase